MVEFVHGLDADGLTTSAPITVLWLGCRISGDVVAEGPGPQALLVATSTRLGGFICGFALVRSFEERQFSEARMDRLLQHTEQALKSCPNAGSNHGPLDLQSSALPTELLGRQS